MVQKTLDQLIAQSQRLMQGMRQWRNASDPMGGYSMRDAAAAMQQGRADMRRAQQRIDQNRKRQRKSRAVVPYKPGAKLWKRTQGLRVRRVRRGRRPKTSKHSVYGCTFKEEQGGIVVDDDCVYLGHGTFPGQRLLQMFARAMVRALLRKAGMDFTSWDVPIDFAPSVGGALILGFRYFIKGGDLTTNEIENANTIIDTASGQLTPKDYADDLLDQLRSVFAGFATGIRFTQFTLNKRTSDATQTFVTNKIAVISADSCQCDFMVKSEFMIQNRTTASGTPGAGELINDVTNNPLVGYRYETNGNGFLVRDVENTGDGNSLVGQGFIGNNQTGIITAKATETNNLQSRKPLPPSAFYGTTRIKKIQVTPGQIRKDTLFQKKKLRLNDFIRMLVLDSDNAVDRRDYRKYGKCSMFGLEKALNSRDSEPGITVGWEMTKYYGFTVKYSNKRVALPIVEIGVNPLGGNTYDNQPIVTT